MVSIPLDVQMESVPDAAFQPRFRIKGPVPVASEIGDAVELLEGSQRPVIILGGGSLSSGAHDSVIELAETLQCPVVTTWLRKDAVSNRHELFFGSLGFGAPDVTERLVREADVILSVGCHFSEFATKRWTLISPESKLVQVDIDPEEIGKIYVPEVGLEGDARLTVEAMLAVLSGLKLRPELAERREQRWRELRASYEDETRLPEPEKNSSGVASAAVVRDLQYMVDNYPAIVVQEAPTFGVWIQRYLLFETPGTYYAAAGGSMGWGLPASFGLQLARPEKKVVGVVGDGAFWMVAQDLETAVREKIPTVTIITNNFAYGNTRDRQRSAHGGRYLGVFYKNPDFAKFAELVGAHGERVERAEDLLPAVKRALACDGPAVIDVIQDEHEGLPPSLQPPVAR